MATTHMTRVDAERRRATVRRILGAGAVALMVSTLLTGTSSGDGHTTFSNTTPIVIPLGPPQPDNCPQNPECQGAAEATPYPSPIPVTGLTGTITDVNVTLHDLTHDGPADLDVMLQAPDGKTTMLMSDACGPTSGANAITTAIDLTFTQESTAAVLPVDTQCTTGTFRPVDDDTDPNIPVVPEDSFPEPAPTSATTADLSVFNGSPPNGTWNLWVVDDWPTDPGAASGQFAGGWSLDILTTTSPTTTSTTTGATTTSTTTGGTTTTTQAGGTSTTTAGATTTTLDDGGNGGGATTTTTTTGGTTTTTSAGGTTTTTPASGPTLALSQTTVSPGDTVVVTGNGLPPNTPVQIIFSSDPVRVGAVTTNAAGSFQTTVTIPSNATAGEHQINVTDSAGRVLAVANLTVVRSAAGTGTLARTGYGVQAMIVLATGLILLGYLFFTSASAPAFTSPRRRHHW